MRITLLLLLGALMLFTGACLFDTAGSEDNEVASLSGTVKNAEGQDLSDARVYIVFDLGSLTSKSGRGFTEVINLSFHLDNDNQLEFDWTTLNETGLAGFNLLGGSISEGIVLNPTLIPATNTSQLHNYEYSCAYGSYQEYNLQILYLDNSSQFCGPFVWSGVPVELSALTAVETAQHNVLVTWVTQSESNLMGYNLMRNEEPDVYTSVRINPSVISGTNTSQEHTYNYVDTEGLEPDHTYYYWLESIDMVGYSQFHGPISVHIQGGEPPVIPVEWALVVYPNPSNGEFCMRLAVPVNCSATGWISNDYTGFTRSLTSGDISAGNHTINWNGLSESGDNVCNGVYKFTFTAKNSYDAVLFQKTLYLVKNHASLQNDPAAYTTSSGYSIPLKKYLQWGTEFVQTDEQGNNLGIADNLGGFTIYIVKEGYVTASRHVSLDTLHDLTEDFVLEEEKSGLTYLRN
jgi:hypothetical protein